MTDINHTSLTEQRMRPNQVCTVMDCSRAKLYNLIAEGEFPPPLKHGSMSYWPASEVQQWMDESIANAKKVREESRSWTVPNLAQEWGCEPQAVRELISTGKLKASPVGRGHRVADEEKRRFESQQ